MTLGLKSTIFYATYMIAGLILGAMTFQHFGALPVLIWFLVFGILQFVLLPCPSCRALAIRTKRGVYVPWTGGGMPLLWQIVLAHVSYVHARDLR